MKRKIFFKASGIQATNQGSEHNNQDSKKYPLPARIFFFESWFFIKLSHNKWKALIIFQSQAGTTHHAFQRIICHMNGQFYFGA